MNAWHFTSTDGHTLLMAFLAGTIGLLVGCAGKLPVALVALVKRTMRDENECFLDQFNEIMTRSDERMKLFSEGNAAMANEAQSQKDHRRAILAELKAEIDLAQAKGLSEEDKQIFEKLIERLELEIKAVDAKWDAIVTDSAAQESAVKNHQAMLKQRAHLITTK